MRNPEDVFRQILTMAEEDAKIRAVMLNGSRANSNAPADIFQDYDVVFFVTNPDDEAYKHNRSWIKRFGRLVICQQNNFGPGNYIFLMQFDDDVRIDLSFMDINKIGEEVKNDTLSVILLDKDKRVKALPVPHETMYYVAKPAREEWDAVLNEIWWIQIYIAKEMIRDELVFVRYLYDILFIEEIKKLVSWFIGNKYDWKINAGKSGKWFYRLLDKEMYDEFCSFYADNNYTGIWNKMMRAGKFVRAIGSELGGQLGYTYPTEEDCNVSGYLERFKNRFAKE